MRTVLATRAGSSVNRRVLAACGAGALLLGAAACGSSDPTNASAQTGQYGQGSQGTQNSGGRMPGVNGKVAAVAGSTAQVQSQGSGQVAVTWNGSTTFTQQVAASLSDVKVGACVVTQPAADSSSASGDATTQPAAITAATVRITEPVDGTCTPSFRGGPGGAGGPQQSQGGQQGEGQPPAGGPGGSTGGGTPRTQFRGLGGAIGKVTAVSATGFTAASARPTAPGQSGSSTTTGTTDVTVTVSSGTTYTKTAAGAAADVKVGTCLRAEGSTDATGAVTARTIALSPATAGECGGFMLNRNGSGAAGPATAQNQQES